MKIDSEQGMIEYGKRIAEQMKNTGSAVVVELVGDVGAGKTTLTRGIAQGLGVMEEVTSPSFTISKSYACTDGRVLTHYDFYRLSDPGIMMDDLSERLSDARQVIVIEWGESVEDLLPENHMRVSITYNDDGTREVER